MYAITNRSWRVIERADQAQAGETVVADLPPALLIASRAVDVRERRARLLRSTDWTQADDAPLTLLERQAWMTYRTALRNLPQAPGFPDMEWPQPPVLGEGTADAGIAAASP